MREALAGWQSAMAKMGVTELDNLIIECQSKPFTRSIDAAYPVFKDWLRQNKNKATAVVCSNMEMGLVANRCARELGMSIPEDFSIVSSDNIAKMGEYFYPPATTIEMDISLYGKHVVELLEQQFENEQSEPQTRLIPSCLVARKTTSEILVNSHQRY